MAKEQLKARSVREIIQGLVGWTPSPYTPRPTAQIQDLRVELQSKFFTTRLQLTGVLVRRVLGVATPQEGYIAAIRFMGWNYHEHYFPTQFVEPSK